MKTTPNNQREKKQTHAGRRVQQRTGQSNPTSRPAIKQRKQIKRSRRGLWLWGGFGAVAIIVLVVLLIINQTQNSATISGVVTYSNLSRTHVTGTVKYAQNPPVGGPHNPVWQNCGIYDTPVANENAVHSMEHGAVWITYQPSLSNSEITQLQNLVRGHSYALLSPYPGLPSPVVISAWGLQLKVNSASDPRLAQFLSKYAQGPQTPEQGAPCTGGTGTPLP